MERLTYFDQMRGIAILAMVIGHVFIFAFGVSNCSLTNSLNIFSMPIFFYISGFLSYKELTSRKELLHRIFRKIVRILPTWLVASVAYSYYDNSGILYCLTDFYWFFYVLISVTLIFILLDFIILRYTKFLYPFVIVLVVCSLCLMAWLYGDDCGFPLNQLAIYSCYFSLGWLCKKYQILHNCMLKSQKLYGISIIVYVYACYNCLDLNVLERIVAGVAAIIVIQHFLYDFRENSKSRLLNFFSVLGQSTIAIYVLNNYFIPDFRDCGISFIGVPWGFIIELIVALCISIPVIGLCVIIKLILQKNKYLKYLVS